MSNEDVGRKEQATPPLLPDELMQLEDIPAEETPREVSERLEERRVSISGGEFDLESLERAVEGHEDQRELVLPRGAFLGRPGQSAGRLKRAEQALDSTAETPPERPKWAPLAFQPRDASQFGARSELRTIDGRRLQPYYGVYGPDDRRVFYPRSYPWQCIGRIFTWTDWGRGGGAWTWSGAGVLVGPRHVLTAGHVCPWGASSWAMKFVPSYWNGAPLLGAGAQSWTSDYRGWDTHEQVAAHDIAVLRLYDPIGSWMGWMGTKVYDSDWEGHPYWTLAGYPGAIAGAERPSYQSHIPVLDDDSDGDATELEHHGDSSPGDSGGPFFAFWDADPYAIGTTSGGEQVSGTPFGWWNEDNNIEAGGRAMVDLVRWAQSAWP